jgi:hypothetical protein
MTNERNILRAALAEIEAVAGACVAQRAPSDDAIISDHIVEMKVLAQSALAWTADDAMAQAMGPRTNPVHPMFCDHNCARCGSGAHPCPNGNPSQCDHPHARND